MNPISLFLIIVTLPLLIGGCIGYSEKINYKLFDDNYGISVQDYVKIYSANEKELLADGNIISITSKGFQLIWTVGPYKGKEVFIPYSMIGSVLKAECDS
jgi:hypothetical protein|tara:strand:+ start:278 stop:577 length:300 start_codon:yes stop_codon:yes gene_type:complete